MSQDIMNYIKPELLVVAVGLYFLGMAVKKCKYISNCYIPLINGIVSLVLCSIYILATATLQGWQDVLMAIFMSLTQAIVVAGISTYADQLIKQLAKREK